MKCTLCGGKGIVSDDVSLRTTKPCPKCLGTGNEPDGFGPEKKDPIKVELFCPGKRDLNEWMVLTTKANRIRKTLDDVHQTQLRTEHPGLMISRRHGATDSEENFITLLVALREYVDNHSKATPSLKKQRIEALANRINEALLDSIDDFMTGSTGTA